MRELKDPGLLIIYAGLIIGLSLVQGVFRYLARRGFFSIARRVEFEARKDFFAQIQRLPLSYLDKTNTGELVSRATNDLAVVFLFFGPGLFHLLNTFFVYVIALSFMSTIDPRLTLLALIPYPLLALATRAYGMVVHPGFEEVQQRIANISTKAQENLNGIRVVKAYNQEDKETRSFTEKCHEYMQQNLKVAKISALFHALFGAIGGTALIIVLWFGGKGVVTGTLTLGELVAFTGYVALLLFPTIAFGWIVSLYQRARAAMDRLNEIFALKELYRDKGMEELPGGALDIEFKNLSFAYQQKETSLPVLKNINIKIPQGTKLGIVGTTASGKSTLVHLIAKLYPVKNGQLFIGGKDINTISAGKLRRQIGFVPQDSFLFSESIKENIAYGASTASREDVYQAASISCLVKDLEEFPEDLDTMVGERGVTLSGGQRQRTALARAILINPRILILDEALASVDTETEGEIINGLSSLPADKTCIIVSHRISSVKVADRIIVLDGGSIVESGSHDTLLEQGGLYARLYKRQALGEELARLE